jgi:cell shape-determining protein MreC
MVISIKEDLALVVANLGSRQGVKVGMPFQVRRGNAVVGTIRVVDVREKIAGAVIQSLSSETQKIEVGDRLKVDAQQ